MSIYTQIYKLFNDLLIADVGLDWNDFASDTGVYPDTALMLVEAVKRPNIKNVLEIGSGVSTLYLAAACRKYQKNFISIEEGLLYLQKTQSRLDKYRYTDTKLLLEQNVEFKNLPAPDFVFLDSVGSTRTSFLNRMETSNWSVSDTDMVIVDDVENPFYACPVIKWFSTKGRDNTQIINMVQRQDRSQLINCLDEKFHSYEWVWSWRPDKKFW